MKWMINWIQVVEKEEKKKKEGILYTHIKNNYKWMNQWNYQKESLLLFTTTTTKYCLDMYYKLKLAKSFQVYFT